MSLKHELVLTVIQICLVQVLWLLLHCDSSTCCFFLLLIHYQCCKMAWRGAVFGRLLDCIGCLLLWMSRGWVLILATFLHVMHRLWRGGSHNRHLGVILWIHLLLVILVTAVSQRMAGGWMVDHGGKLLVGWGALYHGWLVVGWRGLEHGGSLAVVWGMMNYCRRLIVGRLAQHWRLGRWPGMNQHRSVGILNDGDCWHHHSRCLIAEMIWTATFGSRIGSSYWTLLLILGILWREPRTTGSHAPPKTGSGVRDHDLLRIIKLRHGSIVRSVAEYGTFALFNRFCFNDRHWNKLHNKHT